MRHKTQITEPKTDKNFCSKEGIAQYESQKQGKVKPKYTNTYLTEEIGHEH